MELIKKVKKYGDYMMIISLDKEDRELLQVKEGDYLKLDVQAIYKEEIGLPKPPEIHPDAKPEAGEHDGRENE